jgi:hypothetical protein
VSSSTQPQVQGKKVNRGFGRLLDWLAPVLFVVGLAVICLVAGAYMVEFKLGIYTKTLKPSFDGLRAMRHASEVDWKKEGWYRARNDRTGVHSYEPDKAFNGLTLVSPLAGSPQATLLDMNGNVVHEWRLPFSKAWPDPPHVSDPVAEERIHWFCVRMTPNGDLFANYTAIEASPQGYGLVKIDKDSKLIWGFPERVHHNFDIDDAGRIYALIHAIRHEPVESAPHLRTPMIDDSMIVISPDGKELSRISIFDAFAKSKYRHYLDTIRSNNRGDHTHANMVHVVPAAFAEKHEFCAAGDVMVSLRNPEMLAIINVERGEVVWASRGIWEQQHYSTALDNGNILLFDNWGNYGPGGRSRILEWNPKNGEVAWCYCGTEENPLESMTRGSQQLLPNGNVLITESNNGRLVEVTRDNEIVWEYYNPNQIGKLNKRVAVLSGALRYDVDKLTFITPERLAKAEKEGIKMVNNPARQRTKK